MITEQLEKLISKYHIVETESILYGTNIPMPRMVLPTPWGTHIRFKESKYYFFYFDKDGITIYPIDGSDYAFIPWEQVTEFRVSHLFILGKMSIKTTSGHYRFQLNRWVVGCPWIPDNTKYLEEQHYFYPGKKSGCSPR